MSLWIKSSCVQRCSKWFLLAQDFLTTSTLFFVGTARLVSVMPASLSKLSTKEGASAKCPPIPDGYPPNYKPKRCRRCGSWSTDTPPYPQEKSPESRWLYLAWEAGCPHDPKGCHCLLCRKVGGGQWVVIYL